jgi:hypothetical protein
MDTRALNVMAWIQTPGQNNFTANAGGFFLNQLSGMCMAVAGASFASGADVRQYHDETRAQSASGGYWKLLPSINGHLVKNFKSGKCLGVAGAARRTTPTSGSTIARS